MSRLLPSLKPRISYSTQTLDPRTSLSRSSWRWPRRSTKPLISSKMCSHPLSLISMRLKLEKDGKREFVILPYEEFVRVEEALADYNDLQVLRAAKQEEGDAPTLTLSGAKLGMT